MKEVSGGLAYTLYAHDNAPKPAADVRIAGKTASDAASGTAALPLNTWSHLAATYDGATLRIYVNAVQVASQAVTGSIVTSSNPLNVGGNSVWGEYFAGLIDEVRIYGRALTAAEIPNGHVGADRRGHDVGPEGADERPHRAVANANIRHVQRLGSGGG